ncbi:MAG TPA: WYL domain-containing protein [Acidimicrobiales bacterium]|nr:WYL domain-containing protein [Acidimicrobiales bacterium]
MALRSRDRFVILKAVLGMAEEQRGVTLTHAAAELGIDRGTLLSVLSPILMISFRARTDDELIDEADAFELDEDTDMLTVDQAHWLRDMRSTPPSPATAQRLTLAGLVVKATSTTPDPTLDAALDKLEALSGDLVVQISEPPNLEVARDCVAEETPMRFRYAKSGATEVTERLIEPYKVFRSWGSWYVTGKDLNDVEHRVKYFRIDRMLDAEMTKLPRFHPPEVDVPEQLDLDHARTVVTVTVPERLRNLLSDDYSVDETRELSGDRVEAHVGVLGDEQLEYLLLRLGAAATWADPALTARRAEAARRVLTAYET